MWAKHLHVNISGILSPHFKNLSHASLLMLGEKTYYMCHKTPLT